MRDLINEIKKEHVRIRRILAKMLNVVDAKELKISDLKKCCHELNVLWDSHEAKEDHIFNHMIKDSQFPGEKGILEQHRQLRGHWKVLKDALETGQNLKIKVAIDTDGRMLVDKFMKHMDGEERYFDKFEKSKNS